MKICVLAGAALAAALSLTAPAFAQASVGQTASAEQRAEAREIYSRAVAFNTSVSGGQTPQLAAYLRDLFLQGGFADADTLIVPHHATASLLVRYRGDGTGGRPILFMAHMDVVEARREDWERDPYTLIEENGYFYGRGAYDNKSGLAALTATFLQLKRENFTPTRDLVLVFTGDEEVEQATIQQLLAQHRDWLDAEFAINSDSGGGVLSEDGQPIFYTMQTAEKSYASYRLSVRNPGGHSSLPRVDNAIYELAEALSRIRAHQFPVMWNETTIAYFEAAGAQRQDEIGAAMRRFAARPGDRRAAQILARDPFTIGQTRTTCIPTLLYGGHADNALPQSAEAVINCRIFPGVSIEAVQAELARLAGPGVSIRTELPEYFSSDASAVRPDVLAAVNAAAHAIHPGVVVTPQMAVGASDSLFTRAAGIPTFGASEIFIKDSDDFSHGLNERVAVGSFYDGLTFWRVMVRGLAGQR
ncbi:MAG: M20/M25/M40 family metallo-hydrolase [Hyphomonadaceae bacterium]